ncbi:SIS domain-containing protein [Alkaliphilus peptidifermentans]|uniref:Uncharacterized protein, contains SIS (Sugar ISomerase) phosphosugar binding domain n=1 Tax=Alkaliphilus peptidifermentans DSM 18978 TaxID=1120976 RepID=A0A1G5AEP7_9FIRM|nr:SIS domain-containing protein [Alkaliphilus peptidifermentans]SCX76352.1 Uncharacterized protein, contains SIS (Sugar ISomerase) phosphosugar binding domain [Alkaliphilus peptidifermentans DSM 18978]
MKAHLTYFSKIIEILEKVQSEEKENIEKAVSLFCEAVENKQSIFVFGASHAGILTEELFYRAGGLAVINPILESSLMLNTRPITFTSRMERLIGYGEAIAEKTPLRKGDVILCHSVSGRNPVMIDFALKAREQGAKLIAISNVAYSSGVESRHPSGKKLMDLAQVVIDNHGEKGDACVEIKGLPQKVSPSSTVVGAAIANSIVAAAAEILMGKNIHPPILYSANIDGGDQHNNKIFNEYRNVIYYL